MFDRVFVQKYLHTVMEKIFPFIDNPPDEEITYPLELPYFYDGQIQKKKFNIFIKQNTFYLENGKYEKRVSIIIPHPLIPYWDETYSCGNDEIHTKPTWEKELDYWEEICYSLCDIPSCVMSNIIQFSTVKTDYGLIKLAKLILQIYTEDEYPKSVELIIRPCQPILD